MSAPPAGDVTQAPGQEAKAKKPKKKSKKPAKLKPNGSTIEANGSKSPLEPSAEQDNDDVDVEEAESPLPVGEAHEAAVAETSEPLKSPVQAALPVNGSKAEAPSSEVKPNNALQSPTITNAKIEAAAQERDQLRAEVIELRKSLEDIQQRHEQETTIIRNQLAETKTGKEHAESQYRSLLGKVNTIKSQLGERLKADAEELSQTRSRIDQLENEKQSAVESNEELKSEMSRLQRDNEQQAAEVADLRGRTNLSQQNWAKERDDLIAREAYAREEFESAKQAMQDWEVLAMEERSIREGLGERVSELEEQAANLKDAHEKAASDRDAQALTVDGLQRALQDIQDARKAELRDVVTNTQAQLEELRTQLKSAEETSAESQTALEKTREELERAIPFEKEVKEKNLLIGKLRHEAVILNDHLTKALRFLKKGKPEDNVDRQLVTNHLLHFLAFDRSDQKKFQVLQLLAALLGWTDEQREQAGLARPGASSGSLRIPISPFRRTSSTASLNHEMSVTSPGPQSKESLAELWSDFLEREAHEGTTSPKVTSPRQSLASPTNSFPSTPVVPSPKPAP